MQTPLKIYLSDLANTYYGVSPGTIPLACGYLAAYLNKRFPNDVDVKIFRTLSPLLQAVTSAPPDIVGFGIYAWNPRLTMLASQLVKQLAPHALTVSGGPAVELNPSMNMDYLARNPNMDCLVWHEGEAAFANIVERLLDQGSVGKVKQKTIDGSCFLEDGELIAGPRLPLITPLENEVPSPYLSGIFDDLLLDPELMPMIQTTRGCPYSCTFCVSGQPDYNQLRSFDVERVKEEILYLNKRAENRSIRFTDDNFGLLPRDIEIAKFVREGFDAERYPAGLKIYYGKLISERIKECSLILRPLLPLCMSFQSLTPEVLEEIKRPNNTKEKFEDARRWARHHDVAVATELIFGLPKETYESFLQSLDGIVELRVDSVFSTGLMLLEGADLNTEDAREKYGFKTKHTIGADGITQFDGIVNVEGEELLESFDQDSRESLFDTREDLDRHVTELVNKGEKVEVTRLATVYVGLMINRKHEVLGELKNLIINVNRKLKTTADQEFESITEMLCDLTNDFLVPIGADIPEVIEWASSYDLVKWIKDDYQRPISQYAVDEPTDFHLVMNNIAQTQMTNVVISEMDDDKLKMQYYLRHTNSSNVRRRIVYAADSSQPIERHLLNLEGFADAARSVSPEDFSR